MKRNGIQIALVFAVALTCAWILTGCKQDAHDSAARIEAVATHYGRAIELAQAEFAEIFGEYTDVAIDQTWTTARTDEAEKIIVQIQYSSADGSGTYGFEYDIGDAEAPVLIRHGADVTTGK